MNNQEIVITMKMDTLYTILISESRVCQVRTVSR